MKEVKIVIECNDEGPRSGRISLMVDEPEQDPSKFVRITESRAELVGAILFTEMLPRFKELSNASDTELKRIRLSQLPTTLGPGCEETGNVC